MTVVAALGWAGGVVLLFGYAQTSRGRWPADGRAFQACSIFGSVALGLAAAAGGVWSSAALNVAWTAIGIAVLTRRSRRRADLTLRKNRQADDAERLVLVPRQERAV
jgi:hypothetical protein